MIAGLNAKAEGHAVRIARVVVVGITRRVDVPKVGTVTQERRAQPPIVSRAAAVRKFFDECGASLVNIRVPDGVFEVFVLRPLLFIRCRIVFD